MTMQIHNYLLSKNNSTKQIKPDSSPGRYYYQNKARLKNEFIKAYVDIHFSKRFQKKLLK